MSNTNSDWILPPFRVSYLMLVRFLIPTIVGCLDKLHAGRKFWLVACASFLLYFSHDATDVRVHTRAKQLCHNYLQTTKWMVITVPCQKHHPVQ